MSTVSKKRPGASAANETPKRQRASLACLWCRSHKKRCDSQRPACSACVAVGELCVYDEKTKKRGLLPGYVRVLECLFGIITKNPSSEDVVLQLLADPAVWQAGTAEDGDQEDSTLYSIWKKSRLCKAIEDKLSGAVEDVTTLASGPAGDLLQGLSGITHQPTVTKNFGRDAQHGIDHAVAAAAPSVPQLTRHELLELLSTASISLTLPANSWHLLEIFFTFTACWLPIVDRRHILKTLGQYQGEEALVIKPLAVQPPSEVPDGHSMASNQPGQSVNSCGSHAVLWAVMSYASFQERSCRSLRGIAAEAGSMTPDHILELTQSLLSIPAEQWDIHHVQAQLLIALIYSAGGQQRRAWHGVGQASRVLETLIAEGSSSHKMTVAGCYVIDGLISAVCKLPSHSRYMQLPVVDVDGVEEYEPWFNRTDVRGLVDKPPTTRHKPQRLYTTFNLLIELVQLIHEPCPGNEHNRHGLTSTRERNLLHQRINNLVSLITPETTSATERAMSLPPQALHLMIIYDFVVLMSGPYDSQQMEDPVSLLMERYALWQKSFAGGVLPATFSIVTQAAIERSQSLQVLTMAEKCRAIWLPSSMGDIQDTYTTQLAADALSPSANDITVPVHGHSVASNLVHDTMLEYRPDQSAAVGAMTMPWTDISLTGNLEDADDLLDLASRDPANTNFMLALGAVGQYSWNMDGDLYGLY